MLDARDRVRQQMYQALVEALSGRYALEGELGKGGMATVYRARDLTQDREVALKVLHAELAARVGADRFSREIKLSAQLQHPNILPVWDSGTTEHGRHWYAMPLVSGHSLRDRIDEGGRLPIEDAVRIIREAAQALAYAHGRSIIHRDIKPENLLLGEQGTLVGDFGVAKAVDNTIDDGTTAGGGPALTESGFTPGTPRYMSPEQLFGARVDHRSDVYSLAATAYEALTGSLASLGGGGLDLFLQQMSDPMPKIRIHRPEVSEKLEAVVRKGMNPNPTRRYQTMAEFEAALASAVGASPAAGGLGQRVSAAFKALVGMGGSRGRSRN